MTRTAQEGVMKWVLFWVFVGAFVLIVLGTLAALFLDFGNLSEDERERLFVVFIVEIGIAVAALFYSIFELKRQGIEKIRLDLGDLADVRQLVGKTAKVSLYRVNGEALAETEYRVSDENGPYVAFKIPPSTQSVHIKVDLANKSYSGSFTAGTYFVSMRED